MIRYRLAFLGVLALPCVGLSQCYVGGSPLNGYQIVYNLFGPPNNGGLPVLGLLGVCPNDTSGGAKVKYKLYGFVPGSADQLLVVSPSSGTTPQQVTIGINPNAVGAPGTYKIIVYISTVDQTPASIAPYSLTVTLFTAAAPVIQSVVNAASFAPSITPGAEVSILGTNLGPTATGVFDSTGTYPTTLNSIAVTFNGIAAPLLSTSTGRINAIAPYGIAGQGKVDVVVTQWGGTVDQAVSNTFSVPVTDSSVALFAGAPNGTGPPGIFTCGTSGCAPNSAANPAPPGSVIVLYATVGGVWDNSLPDGSVSISGQTYTANPVTLTIGGVPARLLYAGVPPLQPWAFFQVNAVVPPGAGSGMQPVVLSLGQVGTASEQVTLAVQ